MFCLTATNLQLDHFSSYLKKKEKAKNPQFLLVSGFHSKTGKWLVCEAVYSGPTPSFPHMLVSNNANV